MSRNYARDAVFGTLKNFGVAPTAVTPKTKFGAVLNTDVRIDFVRELNEKLPGSRRLDVSHLAFFTIGQVVKMAQLPGEDPTPGRRKPPQPRPEEEPKGGRK